MFLYGTVPKLPCHALQPLQAFPGNQHPRGIPVQAVADGRAKCLQPGFCKLLLLQQVANNIFIGGNICGLCFLGKHADRLIDDNDILVLINNIQWDAGIIFLAL
jgi:hypothetical protein